MAYTVDTIRNTIIRSIVGRSLGLVRPYVNDTDSAHLGGIQGVQVPLNDATSDTTGTNIKGYGWTTVDTSTDDTWLMEGPRPGVLKYIYTGSTSTGIRTIKRSDNTWAIRSSANSTGTTIVAQGGSLLLTLMGISTALYAIVNRPTGFSSACSTEMAINGTT